MSLNDALDTTECRKTHYLFYGICLIKCFNFSINALLTNNDFQWEIWPLSVTL